VPCGHNRRGAPVELQAPSANSASAHWRRRVHCGGQSSPGVLAINAKCILASEVLHQLVPPSPLPPCEMAPKKGKKANESEEERRLRLEMEAIKAEEERREKEARMKAQLKAWQEEETKFSLLNRNKVQNQWRKLMRIAKVEALRKHLEIMSQDHEREVDVKDAIIQMLDRDLDEAEEQFQTALRAHVQNVDHFIELYRSKVRQLELDFEEELHEIEAEFDSERDLIVQKHASNVAELENLIAMIEQAHQDEETDKRQEFESLCEEVKNKNLEDLNVLKLTLEALIEQLEKHFENAHENYLNSTSTRAAQFMQLTARDKVSSQEIENKFRKIQRLQESLAAWKLKINSNMRECEERNKLLKAEKDQVSRHFQNMKQKMTRIRASQIIRQQQLSLKSHNCIETLQKQKTLAESILRLAEVARKLETEREKILPFDPMGGADTPQIAEDMKLVSDSLSSYVRTHDGHEVEEWNSLENFFKKFNFVTLDKLAIEQEQARLSRENQDLRAILKQYLDGISVNSEVIDANNPLLVVNSKSGVAYPPPVVAGSFSLAPYLHKSSN
jgi:dynein regulatory complex subunit 2